MRRYHLRVRESVKDTTPAVPQQLPPDPLASAVARSVSDLRHSAGLSERAAARKLGTSQTQLRRMEDPRYLPSLRSLARLAMVYGYELKVDFAQKGAAVPAERGSRGVQKAAAVRTKAAPAKSKSAPRKRASGSASPSKGRAAAPRRGRAAARGRARRAAPRRRS